jgi:hypothetical protein
MDAPRHVLVVESGTSCAEELRHHHFLVVTCADDDSAFRAASAVDAVLVHLDAFDDAEPRTAFIRRVQTNVATRQIPVVIAITGRPDRPDTVPVQRFGGALIVLTNARCEGVAAVLDELLDVQRS